MQFYADVNIQIVQTYKHADIHLMNPEHSAIATWQITN